MKVTDYKVVSLIDNGRFEEEMRNVINKGWHPVGGVSVYRDEANNKYCSQAVVKYEKEDTK